MKNIDVEALRKTAEETLEKCTYRHTLNSGEKISLKVPSGDMKYSAFWVRDAAMMAESGLIAEEDLKSWICYISSAGQNSNGTLQLKNGLSVPEWAIADHIEFSDEATYFPGTMASGEDQGTGMFGFYPPHDDQYYFIEIAYLYFKKSGSTRLFEKCIGKASIFERLEKAFLSYNINRDTQLCFSTLPNYTVDWGFCDTIKKSGYLLYPSLLRYRAALRLEEIFTAAGYSQKAAHYKKATDVIRENIVSLFYKDGWLYSATELCCQRDVWGTAFAIWLGVLPSEQALQGAGRLLKAYRDRECVSEGQIRQILLSDDSVTAWESSGSPYQTYQNGGYWPVATGWYAYAISLADRDAAAELMTELLGQITAHKSAGAPYEWMNIDDTEHSGLYYGASAALPYTAAVRILEENHSLNH